MGAYQAGSFAVASGNVTVAGLAGKPQGVIFFGSNSSTEDAVVTGGNLGAFMGMMVDDGLGGILAESNSLIPTQGQRSSGVSCILMQSSFNVIEYAATPVSLNANGFTVNFTSAVAGREIQYIAWYDWNSAGFYNIANAQTNALAFTAKASFHLGTIQSGGGQGDWIRADLPGYTFSWWGGASYAPTNERNSLSLIRYPFTGQIATRMPGSGTEISTGAGFIGPFLTEPQHAGAPGTPTTNFDSIFSVGFANMGLLGVWDGPADCGVGTPSGTPGGIVAQSLALATTDAIILFGANGWETGPGVGSSGQAIGFGIWTPTYQGCVMVNQGGNYLYQSRNKAWASDAAAAGVNAGTITHTPNSGQFEFVTGPSAVGPFQLGWIAFVNEEEEWIPHIYRWVE